MAATSQLDEIIAQWHESHPCAGAGTSLRSPAIKRFFHPFISLAAWLLEMFNPPPLESLTLVQRTGRVFLLVTTLVVASILFAMAAAVGLFLMERGRELRDSPQFYHGLVIVLVGIAVNTCCVFVLLQIKKADTKLVPPRK